MDVVYLDSSVLVELLLGSEERRQIIKSIIAGKRRFMSVISFGEVLYKMSLRKPRFLEGVR